MVARMGPSHESCNAGFTYIPENKLPQSTPAVPPHLPPLIHKAADNNMGHPVPTSRYRIVTVVSLSPLPSIHIWQIDDSLTYTSTSMMWQVKF